MVSTRGLISVAVAVAVALGAVFAINKFALNKDFDVQTTLIDFVILGVALWIGSMIANRTTGRKGVDPPRPSGITGK